MSHTPRQVPTYQMDLFDKKIEDFYHLQNSATPFDKAFAAANYFLDCPYFFEPLGEGPSGEYDQFPLYRTDIFDCVTYLNTVLALTKSTTFAEFQTNFMRIRYAKGHVQYAQRTDWFTDLDWLPNTRSLDWIEDVTTTIVDTSGRALATLAETVIDKPNWFQVKTERSLHHLHTLSSEEAQRLLKQLRNEGSAFQAQHSEIHYIPTTRLLDKNGQGNAYLFEQFPEFAIIAFVRPNWEIRDSFKDFPNGYGTNLNVRHVGMTFKIDGEVMLYHASFNLNKVMCMPLAEYLSGLGYEAGVKGIHLETLKKP